MTQMEEKQRESGVLERSAQAAPPEFGDEVGEPDLERINRLSRTPLKAEDVHVRSMYLCSNRLCESDWGRFTEEALEQISRLVVGRSVLRGHDRSSLPLARFYRGEVVRRSDDPAQEAEGGEKWVRAWFYWLKGTSGAEDLRLNIDGGVYREVSISWRYRDARCSVCGDNIRMCGHTPGRSYSGRRCFFEVDEVLDVLEGSFVYRGAEGDAAIARNREMAEGDGGVGEPEREDLKSEIVGFYPSPILQLLTRLPRTLRRAVVAGRDAEASADWLRDLGFWVRRVGEPNRKGSESADVYSEEGGKADLWVFHLECGREDLSVDDDGLAEARYWMLRCRGESEKDLEGWERNLSRRLRRLGREVTHRATHGGERGFETALLAERIGR